MADTTPEIDPKQERLNTLATALKAHGLTPENVLGGLVVRDLYTRASVVVTCRPFQADNRRLWFFSEPAVPLGEADATRMMDTIVAIKGLLAAAATR